eukprot:COSAG06_NODE_14956_length_1111_cov_3.010870_1_plen_70_part_00
MALSLQSARFAPIYYPARSEVVSRDLPEDAIAGGRFRSRLTALRAAKPPLAAIIADGMIADGMIWPRMA